MLLELFHSLSNIFYMALHVVNSGSFPKPLSAEEEREWNSSSSIASPPFHDSYIYVGKRGFVPVCP